MNKTKLLLVFYLLTQLPACRPELAPETYHAVDTMKNWELKSDPWTLKASKTIQQEHSRRFQALQLETESFSIQALQAYQEDIEHPLVQLKNVTGQSGLLTLFSPYMTLDIEKNELTGKQLEISQKDWHLSAQTFNSSSELNKWRLNQVKATFRQ